MARQKSDLVWPRRLARSYPVRVRRRGDYFIRGIVAMIAWRLHRPLPSSEPTATVPVNLAKPTRDEPDHPPSDSGSIPSTLDAGDLYVGESQIDVRNLDAENFVEVAMRAFNGSNQRIDLVSVTGQMVAALLNEENVEVERFSLNSPVVLFDRTQIKGVDPKTEFMLVMEQSLRPAVAAKISTAVRQGAINFYLEDLVATVCATEDPTERVRLRLWDGITVSGKERFIRSGRLTIARMAPIAAGLNIEAQ